MSEHLGSIVGLFRKCKHGESLRTEQSVFLEKGFGIQGDVNGHLISPRQVLMVRHEDLEEEAIAPGSLRENLVVQNIDADNLKPGSLLEFESGAKVRLTFYCEPCKKIESFVEDWKGFKGKRGVLGVVVESGKVAIADSIQVKLNAFPALSEIPYERFLGFIAHIPEGKVVTYREVILGMGVDRSYYRALPQYFRKTSPAEYPLHRILNSKGELISHVPDQLTKLRTEKVDVAQIKASQKVNLKQYLWQGTGLF
ncbi:hypothetical protein Lepto7376_1026 [[Leptolyngbya] sp. PCC 7376]|uniref:MOSC domain-containing protein n=1 Tax=[Leptolyngbya] sp. PCC 7376 TaxID=111781 RepID=UPI00029EDE9D|nr:MOSC domain-containing protein [[Leptolyngbya] sp. PCC 7376]AFY37397.1 hypothetical protein Lepto7376_1026 [[Leptolyngbya] sp. PCC 7376]